MPKWLKITGIVFASLIALIIVLSVIGSIAGSAQKKTVEKSVVKQTVVATATIKPTATSIRNGSCSPQPCANDNYGWIVLVSDFKYNVPSGNDFEKPEPGDVYATVQVTFQNKTSSEQHANPIEFVMQDGSGVKHTVGFLENCSWSAVNLVAGATYGPKCLVFEVAADKPNGLVLVWTPKAFGGDYNMKLS